MNSRSLRKTTPVVPACRPYHRTGHVHAQERDPASGTDALIELQRPARPCEASIAVPDCDAGRLL